MTATIDPKRPDLGLDEAVVARVLAGERALFEVLVRRHNQRVYRAARAVLGRDDEAEDVMQETYVRAFAHLAQFRAEARFSTWITRIAVHEAFARRRAAARTTPTDQEGLESIMSNAERPTPERDASARELSALVGRAIDALPEPFRVVLVLRTVEDMSVAETADCLELPEDTVKTRLFRARALLRDAVADRAFAAAAGSFPFHAPRCDRVAAAVMARVAGSP